ncbi:MAG: Inositol phosphorylceramide synthase [Actinomycetia bacterium]|nr:Inositol phosphorylceramide synthase [Actinomycetes bacterium]
MTTDEFVPAVAAPWKDRLPGARRLRDGHVIYWWGEILAILAFYFVYSAIRNANKSDPAKAFRNAKRVIHWERWLGLWHEHLFHHWAVLHSRFLIITMNYVYGSLHFIVTAGVGVYLYRHWRDDYPRWRNTLAIATGLALIGFITFPLMPPRLLPHHFGFIDTLAKDPAIWSFNSGAVSRISNQYAAMPSVHCCWALWCACVLVPRVKHVWAKVLAALYPCLTVTAIVLTANHYFLDAIGGFVVLGIGYLIARIMTRAGRGPEVEPPEAPESPSEPAPALF